MAAQAVNPTRSRKLTIMLALHDRGVVLYWKWLTGGISSRFRRRQVVSSESDSATSYLLATQTMNMKWISMTARMLGYRAHSLATRWIWILIASVIVPAQGQLLEFRTLAADHSVSIRDYLWTQDYIISATYGSLYAGRSFSRRNPDGSWRSGFTLYDQSRTGHSALRNVRYTKLKVVGSFGHFVDRVEGLDEEGIPAVTGTILRGTTIPGHPWTIVETEFVAYAPFSELYNVEADGAYRAREVGHEPQTSDLWLQCSREENQWTISSQVDWMTVKGDAAGEGSRRIQITVSENPDPSPREGLIDVVTESRGYYSVLRIQRGFLVVQYPAPAATPSFNPDGGFFEGEAVDVTISCATPNAQIAYTVDGRTPTEEDPVVASGSTVQVPLPGILKARALIEFAPPSAIAVSRYFVSPTVAAPLLDPDGGAFPADQVAVTVTCSTAGAIIRYTTDGSTPTGDSDVVANSGEISIPLPGTLRVKAFKEGLDPSSETTAEYAAVPFTEQPEFDPDGGVFIGDEVMVVLSCATPGAVIRYTVDGSEPTEADPAVPSGGTMMVPLPGTLTAKAFAEDMRPSAGRSSFFAAAPDAATPTFHPTGGAYEEALMQVAIGCATPGAVIRYTLDGSEPDMDSDLLPSDGNVLISLPSTLNARAWANEMNPGDVISMDYTRKPAEAGDVVFMEDATEWMSLGDALAVEGDLAVVGAPWYGEGPDSASAGCVYVLDVDTRAVLQKLLPPDGTADGLFGKAVDIRNGLILVGVWNPWINEHSLGAAHLYEAATGDYIRRLAPADGGTMEEGYGFSVALGDSVAAVGTSGNQGTGRVLVFSLDDGAQLYSLVPPDGAEGDQFGFSLAIEDDVLAVGADQHDAAGPDSGAVYLFSTLTGELLRKLTPEEGSDHHMFGHALSASDGRLIVGAVQDNSSKTLGGSAYVFDICSGELLHRLFPIDPGETVFFGLSVASDGEYALVGATGSNNTSGCAYLFNLHTGDYVTKLQLDTEDNENDFGRTLAISGAKGLVADRNAARDVEGEGCIYLYDLASIVQSQPRSFARWLADEGVPGDPDEMIRQICPDRRVAYGFLYAFGSDASQDRPLLNIRMVNGKPVAEMPAQTVLTMPYITLRLISSTNLTDWTQPVRRVTDTPGMPAGLGWYELDRDLPDIGFFRLEAELR